MRTRASDLDRLELRCRPGCAAVPDFGVTVGHAMASRPGLVAGRAAGRCGELAVRVITGVGWCKQLAQRVDHVPRGAQHADAFAVPRAGLRPTVTAQPGYLALRAAGKVALRG